MRSPSPMEAREAIVSYAHKFIGQPYEWGGDGRKNKGFDCSGLVQELLASIGIKFPTDQNAQGIYDHLKLKDDKKIVEWHGNLIFFGKNIKSITHIGITINAYQYIEAGGGDSKNLGGMVRTRTITHRSDCVAIVDFIKE